MIEYKPRKDESLETFLFRIFQDLNRMVEIGLLIVEGDRYIATEKLKSLSDEDLQKIIDDFCRKDDIRRKSMIS